MTDYIKKCKNEECGMLFKTDVLRVEYCSEQCQIDSQERKQQKQWLKESLERHKNNPDIPTCKICGFKAHILIQHISEIHGMTQKQYMKKYNASLSDIYHSSYREAVKTRGKGFMANCKHCGKEFEKITPKRYYCSDECKEAATVKREKTYKKKKNTQKVEQECRQCGKKFKPKKKASYAYFCSVKCRNRFYYELKLAKKEPTPCVVCKKPIKKKHPRKYCSETCKKKVNKQKKLKKLVDARRELYKNTPDIPECKICGFKGKLLSSHIPNFHNMTPEEYCKKYNVDHSSLMYHKLREEMVKNLKEDFDKKLKEYLKTHRPPNAP